MTLLNLNSLLRHGATLSNDVLEYLDKTTSTASTPPAAPCGRILKGRRDDVSDILDFSKVLGIAPEWICFELI